jgi:hypothetical protein
MLVVDGMLNVFGKYTNLKKHEVLELRFKLFGERPEPDVDEENEADE